MKLLGNYKEFYCKTETIIWADLVKTHIQFICKGVPDLSVYGVHLKKQSVQNCLGTFVSQNSIQRVHDAYRKWWPFPHQIRKEMAMLGNRVSACSICKINTDTCNIYY